MSNTILPPPKDLVARLETGNNEYNEDTPLISSYQDCRQSSSPDEPHGQNKCYSPVYITVVMCLIYFVVDLASNGNVTSRLVIFEDLICDDYYSRVMGGKSRDRDCKIEPVQSELAFINGWRNTLECLPGIMVSLPYGILADRYGRKKILLLGMIGCLLSDAWVGVVTWFPQIFSLRAVWISGLWQLIGGGGASLSSITLAMIADVCPAEMRSTAFSQVQVAGLVAVLIAVPVGAALASLNPWIPVLGSMILFALGIFVVLIVVPDIRPAALKTSANQDIGSIECSRWTQDSHPKYPMGIKRLLQKTTSELKTKSPWICNGNVMLVMVCAFIFEFGLQVSEISIQYMAAKFHWEFSKASLLSSLQAGVNIFVLTLVMPALSYVFVKLSKCNDMAKDKRLLQINCACLILGSSTTFLADSPSSLIFGQIIFASGFGVFATTRSFLTDMVDPMHIGTLYMGVTTVVSGGMMIGGPIMAKSLQWGLQLGGMWMGMPFFLTAVMFTLALLAISAVIL